MGREEDEADDGLVAAEGGAVPEERQDDDQLISGEGVAPQPVKSVLLGCRAGQHKEVRGGGAAAGAARAWERTGHAHEKRRKRKVCDRRPRPLHWESLRKSKAWFIAARSGERSFATKRITCAESG